VIPLAVSGLGLEPWLWWPALAGLGALVAMDEHSLAQTWLSQPLCAALLAGLLGGDPAAGLAVGLLLQLAVSGNLPVGASFPLDTGSAAIGVTCGAVLGGWRAPPSLLVRDAWQGEPAVMLGLLVTLAAALSLVGGRFVQLERRARLGWMLGGYRSVRDGDLPRLERLHGRCLVVTALRGGLLAVVWTVAVWQLWPRVSGGLPELPRAALGLLPLLVPVLAAGSLLERFGYRQSGRLVLGGAVIGYLAVRFAG
jgi:mannose/fructose/N-acetylgalactosamine-specific phosphotransferase system component IIC